MTIVIAMIVGVRAPVIQLTNLFIKANQYFSNFVSKLFHLIGYTYSLCLFLPCSLGKNYVTFGGGKGEINMDKLMLSLPMTD